MTYCIALLCTVLHYTVLCCTVLYCAVLNCTALHCTVQYCTVLYCTVLYLTLYWILYCTHFCSTSVLFYTLQRPTLLRVSLHDYHAVLYDRWCLYVHNAKILFLESKWSAENSENELLFVTLSRQRHRQQTTGRDMANMPWSTLRMLCRRTMYSTV